MSLKIKRYVGTIASGSGLYESLKGTLGFQVLINCEDGATDYTIWLTEKNTLPAKDGGPSRAARDFETLGIDSRRLRDSKDFTIIGEEIAGHEISFETDEETYNEKTRVRVKWISEKKDAGVGSMEQRAAALFGSPKPTPDVPVPNRDNDDVPF